MSADFWTELTLKGTEEEIFSMLKVMRMYGDKYEEYKKHHNCAYLENDYEGLSDEDLLVHAKNAKGKLEIECSGPYGVFGLLEEVALFKDLADAAPTASFTGLISGFDSGGDQELKGTLRAGLLKQYTKYPCDEFDEDFDDEDDFDGGGRRSKWDDISVYNPVTKKWNDPADTAKKKKKQSQKNVSWDFTEIDSIAYQDKIFVLTGFDAAEEEKAIKKIQERGGIIKKSTVLKTDYLIVQETYDHETTKYTRAKELQKQGKNIAIISSTTFFSMD